MRTKNPNNEGRLAVLRAYRSNPSATLKELVQATGYSKTAVYYHLGNLQNEGVITRERKPRRVYVQTVKAVKPSVMIDPQKSAAGRQGKGGDAFSPRKSTTEDALEQEARAIGERLLTMHPFMQIRKVDVMDGVALVDRVGVGSFSYHHNSTTE